MLKEEIMQFMRNVLPFHLLSEDELAFLIEDIALNYYRQGTMILVQDGPPSDFLYVVKKGGVKVFIATAGGGETVIDYRSAGESFGMVSLLSGDRSRANVVAEEDSLCYQIPRDRVLPLLQKNPALSEYFLKSFFINFIDKTYDEARKKYSGITCGDRLLFITKVGEVMRREPVTAAAEISIQEAARTMAAHEISSLVIVDGQGTPMGIVTDSDLRERVVARAKDVRDAVKSVMSTTLYTVEAGEYCFEALLTMMRHKIHHVLVMENGRLKGMVTNHDFMVLQGTSPTVLAEQIGRMNDLEGLCKTIGKLHKTIAGLLREGARALNITGVVTEFTEKIIGAAADFIEKEIGPPPLSYGLFLCGEGGRRELTLSFGVRLGIVHEDAEDPELREKASHYFGLLAEQMSESLARCGLGNGHAVLPSDQVMGSTAWRTMLTGSDRSGDFSGEFFELRSIRGDDRLVDELRDALYAFAFAKEDFVDRLAIAAMQNRPPLGFFKTFVVEKSGEHRDELNVFDKGIKPLIDSVRVLCLDKKIKEQTTARRLAALKERGFVQADDVSHAIECLLNILIHGQMLQADAGRAPDNFVNPDGLAHFEKKALKESFLLISALFDIVDKSYRTIE